MQFCPHFAFRGPSHSHPADLQSQDGSLLLTSLGKFPLAALMSKWNITEYYKEYSPNTVSFPRSLLKYLLAGAITKKSLLHVLQNLCLVGQQLFRV